MGLDYSRGEPALHGLCPRPSTMRGATRVLSSGRGEESMGVGWAETERLQHAPGDLSRMDLGEPEGTRALRAESNELDEQPVPVGVSRAGVACPRMGERCAGRDSGRDAPLCATDAQWGHARELVVVAVAMQDFEPVAEGAGGDQAVHA